MFHKKVYIVIHFSHVVVLYNQQYPQPTMKNKRDEAL